MRKQIAFLLAFFMALTCCLLPVAATSEQEPANPRIAKVMEAVRSSVGVDTPGGAVVLVEEGSITLMEGFGYADMSSDILVTAGTTFEIGSLTALLTTATIFAVAEEGGVSLDADIRALLPEQLYRELDLKYALTLRDLLCGRSGFEGRAFDVLLTKPSHRFETFEEALLADLPAQVESEAGRPGSAHSLFAISLAAFAVETATGTDFGELVTSKLLIPLGMYQTVLMPAEDTSLASPAVGYTAEREGVFKEAPQKGRAYTGLPYATGALSTPADLAAFLIWLENTSGQGILSEAGKLEMLSPYSETLWLYGPQLTLTGEELFPTTYGMLRYDGRLQSSDNTLYFGAALMLDLVEGCALITLTNAPNAALHTLAATLTSPSATYLYSGSEGELPELKTFCGSYLPLSAEIHTFVGRYLAMSAGVRVTVSKEEGLLLFGDQRLRQIGPGIFADAEGSDVILQFRLDEEGQVLGVITTDGESLVPIPLYRVAPVAKVLFLAVLILSAWFLLYGLFSTLRLFRRDGEGEGRRTGIVDALPGFFGMFFSGLMLWQLLLGIGRGVTTLSSFYRVLAVFGLVFMILTVIAFILAIVANLVHWRRLKRAIRHALVFVIYLLLVIFWGLVFF